MEQSQELQKPINDEIEKNEDTELAVADEVVIIEEITDKYKMEPEDKQKLFGIIEYQEMFSGPIPPPSMLGKYEQITPGLAQQIVDMAKSEQQHRHSVEDKITDAKVSTSLTADKYVMEGMNLKKYTLIGSFGTSIILIILMGIFIMNDKDVAAFITFVGAIGAFISSIIYGKQKDVQVETIEENQSNDLDSSPEEDN